MGQTASRKPAAPASIAKPALIGQGLIQKAPSRKGQIRETHNSKATGSKATGSKATKMPVYVVACSECGHRYQALVLAGTRLPEVWTCSKCGSERAKPEAVGTDAAHPLEAPHGSGCACCGF